MADNERPDEVAPVPPDVSEAAAGHATSESVAEVPTLIIEPPPSVFRAAEPEAHEAPTREVEAKVEELAAVTVEPTMMDTAPPAGEWSARDSEPSEVETNETDSAPPTEAAPEPRAEQAEEAEPTPQTAEPVAEPAAEGDLAAPAEEAPAPPPSKKRWYVVKVQSGREDSIKEAIERRVRIEALEEFFGQIVIPVETVTEMRNNRKVTKHHKLYPGYLMAEVEYNDRILYLFRETSGVGDFVGGTVTRPPMPMSTNEVEKMLGIQTRNKPGPLKPKAPKYQPGDRLRVKKGTFAGMEGDLVTMMEDEAKVELTLTIFGRPVKVQIDYWDVEPA
jgi:transcription termination/antitermination protein NusG